MTHNPNLKALSSLTATQIAGIGALVRKVTAFRTWAEMREALDTGYLPTIYPRGTYNRNLILVLDWLGYDVWQGASTQHELKVESESLDHILSPASAVALKLTLGVGYFPMSEIRPKSEYTWDFVDTSHD